MKTLIILSILFLAPLCINGQTTSTPDAAKTNGSATTTRNIGGKVVIPSEKASPVGIVKIATAPAISP